MDQPRHGGKSKQFTHCAVDQADGLQIFALFMFCGIFTTLLIPETKRKTLEELAGEVPGTPNYDPESAGHRKSSAIPADNSSGEREVAEKQV